MDLHTFVKQQKRGSKFMLTADGLRLDDVAFTLLARVVIDNGGGDGFFVTAMEDESRAGERVVKVVHCVRTYMQAEAGSGA